nr:MAG TPA: hypothetical protein [Bacteriophage sp.]
METVKMVLAWLAEHWNEIVTVLLAIIGALEVIAKWTETDKDDKFLTTFEEWVKKINGLVIEIISYITKLKGTK